MNAATTQKTTSSHRAPYPRLGESRAIVSRLIFSSDSTLDRLAHRPALLEPNDTLHATFASCVPCLTCGASSRSSPNIYNGSDSDDEYTNNAVRSVRRARADELEGLLADAIGGRKGGGTTTPQPTPTPSRSTRTSAPVGGAPARTPRHISLWGFNLFGNRRGRSMALEGGDDVLHSTATPGPSADDAPPKRSAKSGVGAAVGLRPGVSADDLFARAVLESASRTSAPRTLPGVRVRAPPHRISKEELETEQDRRARRKARKKMRHLAAALAEPNTPEFEGFPCSRSGKLPPQPTFRAPPSGYDGIPSLFM
ncbi:hypothetical protein B0H13DRAFT_229423 [Mycena leptocephala]|nr:hypothetical protein B0H13DRAFT_229423 [Mycena leptocephala]